MKRFLRPLAIGLAVFAAPLSALAGFASNEAFLPAVGRGSGSGGLQFFATVWATNLTSAPVSFTFQFLKQSQANPSPASFSDSLAPGQTKVYENVLETKLGLVNAIGAARITATGEILVSERIFNQPPGADLGDTEGLFFAGAPKSFSISLGQSASIQGVNQGGAENFRYNFALVETAGSQTTANVQVFDGNGTLLGQKAFVLEAFEQLQPNVAEIVPGFSSTNARITATVTAGTGSVLLAGAQVANGTLDSSGFEMSFRDELLGGGGTAGVTSLNSLTGALNLTAGNGISITPSGSSIAIAFTGGGSSGITSVTHDASLTGAGTGASPLAIANGQVVRSVNGLHDAVVLAAGSNVTLTPSGNTLTIASSGSGGGLAAVSHDSTLAGNGTGASPLGVAVPLTVGLVTINATLPTTMTVSGDIQVSGSLIIDGADEGAIAAKSGDNPAIAGTSTVNLGVLGQGRIGVFGSTGADSGLFSGNQAGVIGDTHDHEGVIGFSALKAGVFGKSASSAGVSGQTQSVVADAAGVFGQDGTGLSGFTGALASGVRGESGSRIGVQGMTGSGIAGVRGINKSIANDTAGMLGVDGTGVSGITGMSSAGVRGESKKGFGVVGLSSISGTIGRNGSGAQGELGAHRESTDFGVYSFGNVKFVGTMTATGTKSFVEPHPSDPTKEIRFVCLEGPESGTYFRGSGRITGGFAKIAVPESFRSVSDEKGLTVVATAVGGPGAIWVVKKSLNEIVLQANTDVEFDYVVNGVRKAYRDFEALRDNESFVPEGPDDRRFALYAPEIQRRLVATGIYNADGSVNLDTAKRLGWDRKWAAPVAAGEE